MEKEIRTINKIIREAIIHGADCGGSYDSNYKNLVVSINMWLKLKDLSNEYEVKDKIDTGDGWWVCQIVKK